MQIGGHQGSSLIETPHWIPSLCSFQLIRRLLKQRETYCLTDRQRKGGLRTGNLYGEVPSKILNVGETQAEEALLCFFAAV